MLAVQKEWQTLNDSYRGTGTKDDFEERSRRLDAVLERSLSKGDMRRLAATCDMVPLRPREQSEFQWEVLCYMIRAFVESGDREGLSHCFAAFSQRNDFADRAHRVYLAYWGNKGLKDPVLVLSEAYSRCRIPETRREIANAVRRSFTGSGIRGKDDAEFVRNAMQWYEKEKPYLTLNERHAYAPVLFVPRHDDDDPIFRCFLEFDREPAAVRRPDRTAARGRETGGH